MIVSEEQVRNVLLLQRQMKIENKHASKTPATKAALPKLSSHVQEVNLVKASLSNSPEVRNERIAKLKEHINQGKYQPACAHIASKMVNRILVDNALIRVDFSSH